MAGSGLAGLRDGAAAAAEFLEPVGVSVGEHGEVYVADAAAQRIRAIDANGTVRTLAGTGSIDASGLYVAGGFSDGPALQAHFNGPSAVVLAPDGSLIVADRFNHCLRRLAGGTVTTYAGTCGRSGNADGSVRDATFAEPLSLAYGAGDRLFVADFHNGVREIAGNGQVTTTTLPPGRGLLASSVAVDRSEAHEALLVALESGIARIDLVSHESAFFEAGGAPPTTPSDRPEHVFVDGRRSLGTAYAVVPFGSGRFVYTDLWNHAVRLMWNRVERVLAGSDGDDASYAGGAFRDGPGDVARFDAPLGLAQVRPGVFAVADAGNRRIRLLTVAAPPEQHLADLAAARGAFRIVYIGNSFVDYDSDTHDALGMQLEALLSARPAEAGPRRPVRVFTVKLIGDADAIGSFVQNYFTGSADLVVWQLNSWEIGTKPGAPAELGALDADTAEVWGPALARELRATRDALAADHTRLLVVLNPMPWEISPAESDYQQLYDVSAPAFDLERRNGTALRRSAGESGVAVLDLFPLFEAAERGPDHAALFGSIDHHFSTAGRQLVARAISNYIAREHFLVKSL